ncbi:MAG: hypothetical protein JJE03_06275 [Peptostreptococcaceae bacterium]|nr:hypothetical protein [Peptostreptococcaceae bacterium]
MLIIIGNALMMVLPIMAILFLLWLSNLILSLYYNIKGLGEAFDKFQFKEGLYKILTLVLGTLILTVGIVALLEYVSATGYIIEGLADGISLVAIISIYGSACVYYGAQAITTLKDILIK